MERGPELQQLFFNLRQLQLQAHCPQPAVELSTRQQGTTSLLLLTGVAKHWEAVCTQLKQLPPRAIFLSRAAGHFQQIKPLPEQHLIINSLSEEWCDFEDVLARFPSLEIGLLTRTTLTKVALGIADSLAATLVMRYLEQERSVKAWYPDSHQVAGSLTPRQRVRASQNREYLRTWKQMGVDFLPLATLLANNADSPSSSNRQAPTPNRLWTLDDVRALTNGQVWRIGRRDLITPSAQDELRTRQIEVVREVESHANW